MAQMEKALIQMIATMLRNGVLDFYEEMFALLDLFTSQSISSDMWQMLGILYETFTRDGFDYFTEIMSILYNFMKVDNATFLSNPQNLEVIIAMCKAVMAGDAGEDPQVHACKLLEVVLLQCNGKIDSYIPSIMGIVLERLTQMSKTTELRTMCILVVIAGLYYNTSMMFELLESTHFPDSNESITAQLFKQWVKDSSLFMGVHDRKMSILGFCAVLNCPVKPPAVVEMSPSFIPTMVTQLDELIGAYKDIAGEENDSGDSDSDGDMDEDEDNLEEKEVESDEDVVDEESQEYLKHLSDRAAKLDGDESESGDSDIPQTLLELDYDTCVDEDSVDEFNAFKSILQALSTSDPQMYSTLISNLPPEISKKLEEIFLYADRRKAARDSEAIDVAGGYTFKVTAVPNSFVFDSP